MPAYCHKTSRKICHRNVRDKLQSPRVPSRPLGQYHHSVAVSLRDLSRLCYLLAIMDDALVMSVSQKSSNLAALLDRGIYSQDHYQKLDGRPTSRDTLFVLSKLSSAIFW